MSNMSCIGLQDDTVSILVGGEAGQGISRSGSLLGKALMREGFHAYGSIDYPSLIRGGHNFYVVRASSREVHSHAAHVDLVIALNKETAIRHEGELSPGGGIIIDEDTAFGERELERSDVKLFPVPLTSIVKELGGPSIMRNTVALGAATALVGIDVDVMGNVVAETFAKRREIAEMNLRAIRKGWEEVIEHSYGFDCGIKPGERPSSIWLTGNEAVALGAIQAGCRYYSAYPMTPASPVLHYLIAHDQETGMVVMQAESEIAAIMNIIGAGYAGVRAMTATSGGGFSLMTEALGLAATTETPVVVMLGQRPGPSTGMATYSAQGDLLFAIHASQGEFPRVVVAPGDVEECFYLTMEAFNLADRFQVPVIVLTDKSVIESYKTTPPFDTSRVPIDRGGLLTEWEGHEEYRRYKITENGVSPRLIPGTKNALVLSTSNEHREYGFTSSAPRPVVAMLDKRHRKRARIEEAVAGLNPVKVFGDPDPEVTMVGWGSTKGPAREALGLLEGEEVRTRFVQVVYMEPFTAEALEGYLKGKTVLFETNRTAQLGSLIKLHNGYDFSHVALKYDGRPFMPGEIVDKVKEVL